MTTSFAQDLHKRFGGAARFEEPLGDHTSFRIGGPAEYLVFARARSDIIDALELADEQGIPWLILGRGSNVLIEDAGVRGLVVRNDATSVSIDPGSGLVQCDSGARLPTVGVKAAKAGLTGFEFTVGIPGSVGGGVVMNAGAHDGSIADVLESVEILMRGERTTWAPTLLEHAYRSSLLQRQRGAVVLGAVFRLGKGDVSTSLARVKEYRLHRQATQPWEPGAGSIFRNPPGYSAGALIDQAGLKGTRRGDAVISPKHGNFIVNDGCASSADVVYLIDLARDTVARQFGIELHAEVDVIGPLGRRSIARANSAPPKQ